MSDAFADDTLVHFQLGFARTAQADAARRACTSAAAARLPLEMGPGPRQARQVVFVLRQLHLQHAFTGVRVLGKNIEDERRAVNQADGFTERLLQFTLVARRKFIVEDDYIGEGLLGKRL